MRNLDLSAVHAFVLTAELQSFTRAAEVLNTTQAAVSTKLKRLEDHLGRQLLDRTPRTVRLSAAGAANMAVARCWAARISRAGSRNAAPARRLALGISHHLVGSSLPGMLRKAADSLPGIVLELRVGLTRELMDEYDAGALDAIVLLRYAESQRGGERLALERFGWFAAPDFTFIPGTSLPLATQAPPCSLRAMATERLDFVGVKWREAFVGGGVAIIGAAVEAGIAVAVLSLRVAPTSLVNVGKRLGLPSLPARDVVLHSRAGDAELASSLRVLTAAFRNGS
jgi:DNA-binding transcriptional LysR family regulator